MVRTAEEAGLEELWLWEDCFLEGGISAAAAALAWTERVRVGVGLLPVPLRNVAVTAMEAATLHRMFPGRAIVGVGHGVQDWMGQVGARAESPVTLLREYLVALRALLRGERVTTDGRYVKLDDVGLDWPPQTPVEILAGATGPRTLRLSGEFADGTVLTSGHGPGGRTQGAPTHRRGAGVGLPRRRARGCRLPPHRHRPGRRRPPARRAGDGWPGDRSPTSGSPGTRKRSPLPCSRLTDAGADTVILQPTADEPDPEGFLRFTAEDVRPLVP
jgi:hypothetical protein